MGNSEDQVCLGVIMRPHGVRGAVKIRPFTEDPEGVVAYGPVTDKAGKRSFKIEVMNVAKGIVTARIEGVTDRDAAATLNGTELYVPRTALPEPTADTYYHHDLMGLAAVGVDGKHLGEVVAVHDFGAGDVIEVAIDGAAPVLMPFTREVVPEVDIAGGRLVVVPPPGLMDEGAEGARRQEDG